MKETDRRFPYGSDARFHFHHVHLFASDLAETIDFYTRWFDARVVWDGDVAGARNIFMKVGIGAIHLYEQQPREMARNAIHHLGFQVVDIEELYARMKAAGLSIPNPIRKLEGGGGYFMLGAPDDVLIEVFEPGATHDAIVQNYYGFGDPG